MLLPDFWLMQDCALSPELDSLISRGVTGVRVLDTGTFIQPCLHRLSDFAVGSVVCLHVSMKDSLVSGRLSNL